MKLSFRPLLIWTTLAVAGLVTTDVASPTWTRPVAGAPSVELQRMASRNLERQPLAQDLQRMGERIARWSDVHNHSTLSATVDQGATTADAPPEPQDIALQFGGDESRLTYDENLPEGYRRSYSQVAWSGTDAGSVRSQFAYTRMSELFMGALTPLASVYGASDFDARWHLRWAADRRQRPELDRQLQHALQVGMTKVQSCWQRTLLTDGALSGQMTLALTFDRDGFVERVQKTTDNIRHDELDKCVLAAAKRVKTATAIGERLFVELPLQFSPHAS